MSLPEENQALLTGNQKHVPSESCSQAHALVIPAIMLVQLSICILAWAFSGSMMHETIALPDNIVVWIQSHPNDTQVVITLIATIIALISTFFLRRTIRYALVRRLSYAPLSLRTMVEWGKLAQRSVSIKRRYLSWTLLSIVWISLLSFLTTAWSSLLTPESVAIRSDVQSTETNFLNPFVSDFFDMLFNTFQPTTGFSLTPSSISSYASIYGYDITTTLMNAGVSAALAKTNIREGPATNFISLYESLYVSNISTGGIFPSAWSMFPRYSYPRDSSSVYWGISTTFNLTQRGFTANISCRAPTSSDPAIKLNLTNSFQINEDGEATWSLNTYSWSVDCDSGARYFTRGVTIASSMPPGAEGGLPGENALFMTSVCFGQGFDGPSNQSFLVLLDFPPDSNYTSIGPQICQATLLVTTVRAMYDETGIINIIQPPVDEQLLPDPAGTNNTGILMWFPAYTIWSTLVNSQGITSNSFGDSLLALNLGMNVTLNYSSSIEEYFRGMIEYTGSLMAIFISPSTDPDMVIRSYGTMNVHTLGWTFHTRTHGPSLALITLVTIVTVAMGGYAMLPIVRYDGTNQQWKLETAPSHSFDPTGTMDLLHASSAGDLAEVLSESVHDGHVGSGDRDRSHREPHGDLRIMLRMTHQGKPALSTVASDGVAHDPAHTNRRGSLSSNDNEDGRRAE